MNNETPEQMFERARNLRVQADDAWARGNKESSTSMHAEARRLENEAREKLVERDDNKHAPECPGRSEYKGICRCGALLTIRNEPSLPPYAVMHPDGDIELVGVRLKREQIAAALKKLVAMCEPPQGVAAYQGYCTVCRKMFINGNINDRICDDCHARGK